MFLFSLVREWKWKQPSLQPKRQAARKEILRVESSLGIQMLPVLDSPRGCKHKKLVKRDQFFSTSENQGNSLLTWLVPAGGRNVSEAVTIQQNIAFCKWGFLLRIWVIAENKIYEESNNVFLGLYAHLSLWWVFKDYKSRDFSWERKVSANLSAKASCWHI